jgi:hypothetical protein
LIGGRGEGKEIVLLVFIDEQGDGKERGYDEASLN